MGGHTRGPWKAVPITDDRSKFYCYAIMTDRGPGSRRVAMIGNKPFASARNANARLIAAAPDLLTACAAMLQTWGSDDEDAIIAARDQARSALAKATGKEVE